MAFKTNVFLRRIWMRFFAKIGRARYSNDTRRLETAYRLRDPWAMDSDTERNRFNEINRFIREQVGKVGAILELGSGEGHHTAKLLETGATVDGLEVSGQAIARARARCPTGARFFQTDLPAIPEGLKPQYDLVIASEVLYYLKDTQKAVNIMNRYGRFCLASFFEDEAPRLAHFFQNIRGVNHRKISNGGPIWHCYLWTSSGDGQG